MNDKIHSYESYSYKRWILSFIWMTRFIWMRLFYERRIHVRNWVASWLFRICRWARQVCMRWYENWMTWFEKIGESLNDFIWEPEACPSRNSQVVQTFWFTSEWRDMRNWAARWLSRISTYARLRLFPLKTSDYSPSPQKSTCCSIYYIK